MQMSAPIYTGAAIVGFRPICDQTRRVMNMSVTTTIEQYNLTLTLPLDKLTTSYASDPPLAQTDIINLVARGKTTQESAASSQSTDSMIASQVARQLSSSVQKLGGISSLQIDPIVGAEQSESLGARGDSAAGKRDRGGGCPIDKRWSVRVERDQLGGVSVDGRYHKRF